MDEGIQRIQGIISAEIEASPKNECSTISKYEFHLIAEVVAAATLNSSEIF